jgi:hypothetical protein
MDNLLVLTPNCSGKPEPVRVNLKFFATVTSTSTLLHMHTRGPAVSCSLAVPLGFLPQRVRCQLETHARLLDLGVLVRPDVLVVY